MSSSSTKFSMRASNFSSAPTISLKSLLAVFTKLYSSLVMRTVGSVASTIRQST